MGFIGNTKGSIISEYFKMLSNVECIGKNNAVNIALYENYLTLSNFLQKQPLKLNYSQINDVFYGTIAEMQNTSVIGRAFVGGVLFGGVGALVGLMSAGGKKLKKVFIISYTTPKGEECFLRFQDTRNFKGKKLSNKLKELCDIQ